MLRGVRGATTVDQNDRQQILDRTAELLTKLLAANNINIEDIGAAIFSATPDLTPTFPAAAARQIGWDYVPLFGAQELDVPDSVPLCIRVLLLWNTDISQNQIQHCYLHGAIKLRPDIAR